jgi:lysophospholipase L1-like esterase
LQGSDLVTSQPNPFAPHWLIRDIVIASHRAAVGPGGLLFVGDSLVEGFYWNRVGSLPVLNAGYSGIWTEALEPRIPLLLQSASPSLAVLLVGTNDAKKDCTEAALQRVSEHFVDLHKAFGDGSGAAREGLTTDGVHLSAEAYRQLHGVLEKTVAMMAARKGQ